MTSNSQPNCHIRQSACGLQAGQIECSKCGIHTDARYVSEEDMDMAVAKGTALYWQNHAQALEQTLKAQEEAKREQLERAEIERAKAESALVQAQKEKQEAEAGWAQERAQRESAEQRAAQEKAKRELLEHTEIERTKADADIDQFGNSELIDNQYQVLKGGRRVKDLKTGLIWQRCVVGHSWDGENCSGVATQFRFDQALQTTGKGWRLPTLDELKSLVNKKAGKPAINQKAFPITPPYYFWTSTENDVGVACVGFAFGNTDVSRAYMSSTFYVRLVQEN